MPADHLCPDYGRISLLVASALLKHAHFLLDQYDPAADPYTTVVGHFTATRQLAGMRRLVEEDITDRLRSRSRPGRSSRPTPTG